jgi:hypothetical protein
VRSNSFGFNFKRGPWCSARGHGPLSSVSIRFCFHGFRSGSTAHRTVLIWASRRPRIDCRRAESKRDAFGGTERAADTVTFAGKQGTNVALFDQKPMNKSGGRSDRGTIRTRFLVNGLNSPPLCCPVTKGTNPNRVNDCLASCRIYSYNWTIVVHMRYSGAVGRSLSPLGTSDPAEI